MFRDLLRDVLGLAGSSAPYSYEWQQLAVAVVGAGVFLGLIPVFTRIYFAMNRNGSPSRTGGLITGIAFTGTWVGITLDLLGYFSMVIFLVAGGIVLLSVLIYEIVSR